jgi:hypothetical protein
MHDTAALLDRVAMVIEADDDDNDPITLDTPDGILHAVQLCDDGYLSDGECAQLDAALKTYPPLKVRALDRTVDDVRFVGDKIVEGDRDTFTAYTPEEWMRSTTAENIIEEIAGKIEERIDRDYHESPGKLWHATDAENIESIMRDGLRAENQSRGLTNRSVGMAIFTTDDRSLVSDAYGDTVLEIDLSGMQRDGIRWAVSQEPSVSLYEAESALAHMLDLDDYSPDNTSDGADDPSTIILYVAVVPPKYLRVV